jgi:hypothetical protein
MNPDVSNHRFGIFKTVFPYFQLSGVGQGDKHRVFIQKNNF